MSLGRCWIEAITASTTDSVTKMPARTVVDRVRKSAAPRADMNPAGLPPTPRPPPSDFCIRQIGRASCRESVCKYVSISVVAVPLEKQTDKKCVYEQREGATNQNT